MIISHKHKLIFFSNGRTGTTSIESVLMKYQEDRRYEFSQEGLFTSGHIPPQMFKQLIDRKIWRDYLKFTFVRNPFDWFVSQYFYNLDKFPKDKSLRNFLPHKKKMSYQKIKNTKFNETDIIVTYNYLKRYRAIKSSETLLQYNYVFDENGNQLVNVIGRFENIDKDFNAILEKVGIAEELPKLNKTDHNDYQFYFDKKVRKLFEELYKLDLEAFNYNF